MPRSHINNTGDLKEAKLPRRDWILLPMLSMLTIFLLLGSTELIARRIFSAVTNTISACLVLNDQSTGVRGRPNTTCVYKRAEHQLVEYKFNSCGYRAGMECGPKPTGTYRIVLMGASYSLGLGVPRANSFAALLPAKLSQLTGRKVEVYNEAMWAGAPHRTYLSFNDVLAANPDMILWQVTPWDVLNVSALGTSEPIPPDAVGKDTSLRSKVFAALKQLRGNVGATGFLIRHFIYESQSLYLRSVLMAGDDQSGYLKSEPSALWQSRLNQFDFYAADMEERARAAGVPFVVVLVPNRAQAAMISARDWPDGYDPYKLNEELRSIITSHGGIYIDILPDLRNIPNSQQLYFPIDDHPDVGGHELIAELLAKELTNGTVPALKAVAQPQVVLKQGR